MTHSYNITRFHAACDLLFPHNNQETAVQGKILLLVAQQDRCTARFLTDTLQVSQPTVSRETRALSKRGDRRKKIKWEGRGLIRSYPDPGDPRRLLFTLSDEGHLLFREIARVLSEENGEVPPASSTPPVGNSEN